MRRLNGNDTDSVNDNGNGKVNNNGNVNGDDNGGINSDTSTSSSTSLYSFSEITFFEVEVKLLTGRTHQIRLQLSAEGAPLVGDSRYEPVAGLLDNSHLDDLGVGVDLDIDLGVKSTSSAADTFSDAALDTPLDHTSSDHTSLDQLSEPHTSFSGCHRRIQRRRHGDGSGLFGRQPKGVVGLHCKSIEFTVATAAVAAAAAEGREGSSSTTTIATSAAATTNSSSGHIGHTEETLCLTSSCRAQYESELSRFPGPITSPEPWWRK